MRAKDQTNQAFAQNCTSAVVSEQKCRTWRLRWDFSRHLNTDYVPKGIEIAIGFFPLTRYLLESLNCCIIFVLFNIRSLVLSILEFKEFLHNTVNSARSLVFIYRCLSLSLQ